MALIVDSYGREVSIPRIPMTIAGNWKSLKQTMYTIVLAPNGEISSLTKANTNMWKAGASFEIVQQPLPGRRHQIFAAVRPDGRPGNFRLFKYDSDYPLEMDLLFMTRGSGEGDDQSMRMLIKLQRITGPEESSLTGTGPSATYGVRGGYEDEGNNYRGSKL